jgi:hypothetical protein
MRLLSACLMSAIWSPLADSAEPPQVAACLHAAGPNYAASRAIVPSYLAGDFDGDSKPDVAVVVNRGKQQGIAACLSGTPAPVILGAGAAFNEMPNLDFTAWRLHLKSRRVARGFGQGRPPVLKGDALYLEWESGSAVVYWNGRRFVWYQQGD